MKVGVLMIALLAASAAPSALAKATGGHHAHRAGGVKVSAQKASAHRSAPASGNAADAKRSGEKSDKINVEASPMSLPSRDKSRNVKPPKLQIVRPETVPLPHAGIVGPAKPIDRNAIGQGLVTGVKTGGLQPEKAPAIAGLPRQGAAPLTGVRQTVRPGATVSNSSGGKIDGTGLIRPALTAAIGGPAKPSGGIDGTLLRPKHR